MRDQQRYTIHVERLKNSTTDLKDMSEQELIQRRDTIRYELVKVEEKLITLNTFLQKGNDSRYAFHFSQRKEKSAKKVALQTEIAAINLLLKKGRAPMRHNESIMKELFFETFGGETQKKFFAELGSRLSGGNHNKIEIDFDKVLTAKHKALLADYYRAVGLIEDARKTIDAWIRANEPVINKGDYLEYIKEIAFSLPPMSEIIKMKRNR